MTKPLTAFALLLMMAALGTRESTAARSTVEIRSYNLKPGMRSEFHKRVVNEAMPLLRKWKVDVVAYGPSPHDTTSYYLIRRFSSLEDREHSEDAFYGSTDWREGPRERILELIDTYATIVLPLSAAAIDSLRATMPR